MDWIFLGIFAIAGAAVVLQRRGGPRMETFSFIASLTLIYALLWIIWAAIFEFNVINLQVVDTHHHFEFWCYVQNHQIFHFQCWNPGRDYSALPWFDLITGFVPPAIPISAFFIWIRKRRPLIKHRFALFAVIAAIIQFIVISAWSLWGAIGEDLSLAQPSLVIRLGWQPNRDNAIRLALSRTASAVAKDPGLQLVEVRWTDSFLLGFDDDSQGYLVYDLKGHELVEVDAGEQKGNGANEDWKPVDRNAIQALAQRGAFDEELLQTLGSQNLSP